jgi:integrase
VTKLNSLFISNVKTLGRYYDGNGLYLLVQTNAQNRIRKSWMLRFASPITKRRRDHGLGGVSSIRLADVRKLAIELKAQIHSGIDPLTKSTNHRITTCGGRQVRAATTFEIVARNFHATHQLTLKNEKYRQQWIQNLDRYLFRDLGGIPVDQLKANQLAKLLQPLAVRIPDSTRKIIGQLDLIFRDCIARDILDKNEIDKLKLLIKYVRKSRAHFLALDWRQAPSCFDLVRTNDSFSETTKNAFLFGMLTASRTSEVIKMRWSEVSLEESLWRIPGERMKAGLDHEVSLSRLARVLLVNQSLLNQHNEADDLVFPSNRSESGYLSDNVFSAVISRIGLASDTTYHGLCRATFSTWSRENNIAEPPVIEACLAHTNPNMVERAYDRSKHISARAALLSRWAEYLTSS